MPVGMFKYDKKIEIHTVMGAAANIICLSSNRAIAGANAALSDLKFNNKTKFWALGMQLMTKIAAMHILQGGSSPMHDTACTRARVQAGRNTKRTADVAMSCLASQRSAGCRTSDIEAQTLLSESESGSLLALFELLPSGPATVITMLHFILGVSDVSIEPHGILVRRLYATSCSPRKECLMNA